MDIKKDNALAIPSLSRPLQAEPPRFRSVLILKIQENGAFEIRLNRMLFVDLKLQVRIIRLEQRFEMQLTSDAFASLSPPASE